MSEFEITRIATDFAAMRAAEGALDSKVGQVFRSRSEPALAMQPKQITINFRNLATLDASAAGMPMFFNRAAKTKGKQIDITEASAGIQPMLNRANLGKRVCMK